MQFPPGCLKLGSRTTFTFGLFTKIPLFVEASVVIFPSGSFLSQLFSLNLLLFFFINTPCRSILMRSGLTGVPALNTKTREKAMNKPVRRSALAGRDCITGKCFFYINRDPAIKNYSPSSCLKIYINFNLKKLQIFLNFAHKVTQQTCSF